MRRLVPLALLALAACAPQSAALRVVMLCAPVQVQGGEALGCQGVAAPADAAR
jgi:hypothetical protein